MTAKHLCNLDAAEERRRQRMGAAAERGAAQATNPRNQGGKVSPEPPGDGVEDTAASRYAA